VMRRGQPGVERGGEGRNVVGLSRFRRAEMK
jgi:hypothetical protein